MITLENVTKIYPLKGHRDVPAVQGVSLSVRKGEFLVITGRSGSGKTTLLNLVAGLTKPTTGRVMLDDVDVWNLPEDQKAQFRNQRIGFVFQFPSLLPSFTVLANVLLPTVFRKKPKTTRDSALLERATSLLVEVGLEDKLDAYPRQLSAGQQQRVVIARALINQPELLLADEPTSDLDERTEHEVMALFRSIYDRTGITILMVTHASELVSYGTRSIRMAGGCVVL